MKKKLVVLSIVSLMSVGLITYAVDTAAPNIEKSNVYLEEARAFTRKNDYANAEKKLNEAIKLNNNNAYAYYELGQIEANRRNNDKAISYFNKAIQISPDEEEFYFARGGAEVFKYQLKAFINDMNTVIKINPKNGQAYGLLAATYSRYGLKEQAFEYINKAIQYEETSLDMLYQIRAELKVQSQDYDGAIADYNKAIVEAKKGSDSNIAQKVEYLKQKIFEIQEAKKAFK